VSNAKVPAPGDIDYIESLMGDADVTFTTTERPPTEVTMRLSAKAPVITGGYGGWSVVSRPRLRSVVEWVGVDPMEVTIDVLIDSLAWPRTVGGWEGWDLREAAHNVHATVRSLEEIAKPTAVGQSSPTFKVKGKLVPSNPTMTWVISALKWGDTIYNTEGFIIRQEATITILQADGGEHVRILPPVKKRNGGKGPSKVPQYHIWKKGNTFELISIRYYGNPSYRQAIMKLNKIRDWKKVKVGQKIKLPRPK
jgi:nucleoid-associated protein YgaU